MAAPMLRRGLRSLSSTLGRLELGTTKSPGAARGQGSTLVGGIAPETATCTKLCVIHTSSQRSDLNEFFDKKSNWAEPSVRVGRPYKMDELRLKSNSDLHKLWYVLLKERNMLMTMAAEYKSQSELFPNPERLEKVEDSMESVLDVVRERDTALALLETGEPPLPGRRRWAYNALGVGYWRKCVEYRIPVHMNNTLRRVGALAGPWQQKHIRLWREAQLKRRRKEMRHELGRARAYQQVFADNKDITPDIERFERTMASTLMKGPKE